MYVITVFKMLYVRQGRTVIPERWEKKQMNLWLPLLTGFGEFPGHSTRRGNQGGAWYTPWVEDMKLQVSRVPRAKDPEERE